ncbi:MAG TPA: tyrosine-type recombinase/integrase [Thermodesulfobacteriota bacterium]|nr:tyrosine-type recombinase/integrase [Thermodesulfobacteriota bacterium]
MAVYKKKNRWYIDYYLPNGDRKREVVTIEGVDSAQINRQDAIKALSIRKAEMAQGKFDITQTKKPVSIKQLCDEYFHQHSKENKRSWKRDRTTIKHFLEYFGDKNIGQLNSFVITGWRNERSKQVKKATVNRELDTIRNMFNKAVEWGYIDRSPYTGVEKYKVNNTNLRILSKQEFALLVDAATKQFKPLLLLAVNTGMRPNEMLSLKWEDVNLDDGYLLVRDSKNYESRYIPIHKDLVRVLNELKSTCTNEYVFNGRKSYRKQWDKAFKLSGIKPCRFYDLRHTFASNLVMSGVDIATVKELMGHKDISMTMRYSHPSPEHKKQAINGLNFTSMDTYLDTNENISTNNSKGIIDLTAINH